MRIHYLLVLACLTGASMLAVGAGDGGSDTPTATTTTKPAAAPQPPEPTETLTVATYNINYGNVDLKAVTSSIQEADADLVLLQETNAASQRHFRKQLSKLYPAMLFRHDGRVGGLAYLSKTPLRGARYLPRKFGRFGALIVQLKFGDRWVQAMNLHLAPVIPRSRNDTAQSLAKEFLRTEVIRLREIGGFFPRLAPKLPTIIGGDLNSISTGRAPQFLAQKGFVDSFASVTANPDAQVSWRWRYNNVDFQYRIDYVHHDKHFKTLTSKISPSKGSDHYIVASKLQWVSDKPTASQPASPTARQPDKGSKAMRIRRN